MAQQAPVYLDEQGEPTYLDDEGNPISKTKEVAPSTGTTKAAGQMPSLWDALKYGWESATTPLELPTQFAESVKSYLPGEHPHARFARGVVDFFAPTTPLDIGLELAAGPLAKPAVKTGGKIISKGGDLLSSIGRTLSPSPYSTADEVAEITSRLNREAPLPVRAPGLPQVAEQVVSPAARTTEEILAAQGFNPAAVKIKPKAAAAVPEMPPPLPGESIREYQRRTRTTWTLAKQAIERTKIAPTTVSEVAEKATTAYERLPRDLAGAKPRFNIGQNTYTPIFENDVDKAAYILAQKTPSKRDADYLEYVMRVTGMSEEAARTYGREIKGIVKNALKGLEPGEVPIRSIWKGDAAEKEMFETVAASAPSIANKAEEVKRLLRENPNMTLKEAQDAVKARTAVPTSKATVPDKIVTRARELMDDDPSLSQGDALTIARNESQRITLGRPAPAVAHTATPSSGSIPPIEPPIKPPIDEAIPSSSIEPSRPTAKADIERSKLLEAWNLPRAIKASMDVSAPFRQGFGLIHKKAWWTSWDDMVKSFGSENAFNKVQDSILQKPLFQTQGKDLKGKIIPSYAEESGLQLTDLLTKREENYVSTWAERIPGIGRGVKASNRAYVAFLNKLRADTFESLINNARKAKGYNPEEDAMIGRNIAKFINDATGRGNLGKLEKSADVLNNVFFSPRLIASRVSMMNPANYISEANKGARLERLKSLGAMTTAWGSMATLASMAGADVVLDPTNSDFGKIRIGDTRIDPGAGFQQYLVLAARQAMGQSTSPSSGNVQNLWDPEYGGDTPGSVGIEFGANKLHPILSFAWGLANPMKRPWLGPESINATSLNPVDNKVMQLFIPMIVEDLFELAQKDPESLGALVPAAVGMGISTFEDR